MSWRNEPPTRRQTYKLGVWAASKRDPNRVVLYSPHTRRIFTPRVGEYPALEFAKGVASLAAAVERAKAICWSGDFEPVEGGWE